jgi:hypothetical protein
MRSHFIVILLAVIVLAACNQSPAPPSVSAPKSGAPSGDATPSSVAATNDGVWQKLKEIAGSGATDCGRVTTQAADQTQKASDCAMNASKRKQAFWVAYDMPGLSVGIAGNKDGKMFAVQSEQAQAGGAAEVQSTPCPSELRVAQSGRVTCMAPGSGMSTIGGGNPHGSMGPATGASPHGGGMMSMPDLSKSKAKPAHPPTSSTPPRQ